MESTGRRPRQRSTADDRRPRLGERWAGLTAATSVVGVIGYPVGALAVAPPAQHGLRPPRHRLGLGRVPGRSRPGRGGPGRGTGPRDPGTVGHHAPQGGRRRRRGRPVGRPRSGSAPSTVWSAPTDRWRGDNTDGAGFVAALARGGRFEPSGRRCLVVGAGGAGRAVVAALGDAGAAEVVVVNRTAAAGRGGSRCSLARPAGWVEPRKLPRVTWWSTPLRWEWAMSRQVRPAGRSTRGCSGRARWSSISSTTRRSPRGWRPRQSGGRRRRTASACSSTRPLCRSSTGPAIRPRWTPCGRPWPAPGPDGGRR